MENKIKHGFKVVKKAKKEKKQKQKPNKYVERNKKKEIMYMQS